MSFLSKIIKSVKKISIKGITHSIAVNVKAAEHSIAVNAKNAPAAISKVSGFIPGIGAVVGVAADALNGVINKPRAQPVGLGAGSDPYGQFANLGTNITSPTGPYPLGSPQNPVAIDGINVTANKSYTVWIIGGALILLTLFLTMRH